MPGSREESTTEVEELEEGEERVEKDEMEWGRCLCHTEISSLKGELEEERGRLAESKVSMALFIFSLVPLPLPLPMPIVSSPVIPLPLHFFLTMPCSHPPPYPCLYSFSWP